MIAAVCWLPKGAAKPVPEVAERSAEELHQYLEDLELGEDDHGPENENEDDDEEMEVENVAAALAAAEALGSTSRRASVPGDELAELNMDDYDDEDDDVKIFGNGGAGCAYYKNGEKDPYLDNEEDDDEEEVDDRTIRPSDLLLLAARNEEEISHLEVWIYEEESVNMYVHHELLLPAVPLCLAWLDCDVKTGDKGSFVAVGSMQPAIEIWDLDIIDEVEPAIVLGGAKESKKKTEKKKKKTKKTKLKKGSHSEAVLGLAWNAEFRNVLASASADHSVKVWDIATQECVHTFKHHSKEVQAVAWSPQESKSLLSGSFDKSVVMIDMRAPESEGPRWNISSDVECIAWNPHAPHSFVVSSEAGLVQCFDARAASSQEENKSLFTIHAHEKAACAISFNSVAPNLLATASSDKFVKLWDLSNNTPSCLASYKPNVGAIFAASFCKDSPFLLAVGGSKGKLHVWDTLSETEVSERFNKA